MAVASADIAGPDSSATPRLWISHATLLAEVTECASALVAGPKWKAGIDIVRVVMGPARLSINLAGIAINPVDPLLTADTADSVDSKADTDLNSLFIELDEDLIAQMPDTDQAALGVMSQLQDYNFIGLIMDCDWIGIEKRILSDSDSTFFTFAVIRSSLTLPFSTDAYGEPELMPMHYLFALKRMEF